MATTRPRRIDDALSQLIDSLTPPLRAEDLPYTDEFPDQEAVQQAITAEEEKLQRENHEYAWQVLDAFPPPGPDAAYTPAAGEGENNPAELIKFRLLHDNASPEKAVRFSNLYGRLLNQPVLSRKWGILGMLYQISGVGIEDGIGDGQQEREREREKGWDGQRSRSPLMDEGSLENILMKGSRTRRRRGESNPGRGMANSEDEGPAVSSSVSQRGGRLGRRAWESEVEEDEEEGGEEDITERAQESRSSRFPGPDRMEEQQRHQHEEDMVSARQSLRNGDGAQKTRVPPSERGLLRDLPYNLQGLTSSHLEFVSSSALKLPSALPVPIISLLNTLAEPCLLYRGLSD